MRPIREAQRQRTMLLLRNPQRFVERLSSEISRLELQAWKRGLLPMVQLNGASDIDWPDYCPDIFVAHPSTEFVDYTKDAQRVYRSGPANHTVVLSRTEHNETDCLRAVRAGHKIAVVFHPHIPRRWKRWKVVNGDLHNARFMREARVVGLKAKGKARYDSSGFVVRTEHYKGRMY